MRVNYIYLIDLLLINLCKHVKASSYDYLSLYFFLMSAMINCTMTVYMYNHVLLYYISKNAIHLQYRCILHWDITEYP